MHNLNLLTLLLQALIFAPAALAAPLSDPTFTIQDNAWKFGTGGGIIGLIVLVMDVIVFCMFQPLPHLSPRSTIPAPIVETITSVIAVPAPFVTFLSMTELWRKTIWWGYANVHV